MCKQSLTFWSEGVPTLGEKEENAARMSTLVCLNISSEIREKMMMNKIHYKLNRL